jgi:hypothetical protein
MECRVRSASERCLMGRSSRITSCVAISRDVSWFTDDIEALLHAAMRLITDVDSEAIFRIELSIGMLG